MVLHVEPAAVEIDAAPERVRDVVLDFADMPTWHSQHFKSIAVKGKDRNSKDLIPGDKLEVQIALGNMTFTPTIRENTPQKLHWRGSLPFIFTGDHVFEFKPSTTNPGGTTFVQYEDFSGLLAYTMDPARKSGARTLEGFQAFNTDLKRRCEAKVPSDEHHG